MDKSKWEYKKLGEVCDFICSGGTPKRSNNTYWNGNIPWIKISNLTGSHISSCDEYITEEGLNNSSAKLLPKGTILYSIFATIGAIGILDFEATTNQAIAGLKVKEEYDTNYIFYVLKSLRPYFEGISKGVAQNNINLSILRNKEIPIPPLPTQHQIVSELDQLSNIISLKQQQIKEYDALTQSLFYEMFGDPIDNPNNYPILAMCEVCSLVTDGTHNPPHFIDSGIPFILVSNIKDNEINFDTKKFISDDDYKTLWKSTPIEEGDLLYTCVGSYGNPAIVKSDRKFMFQRHISLLKIKHEQIDPYFMLCFLNTPYAKSQADSLAKGIAQKTITLTNLKKMKVLVPPLPLQHSFAEKVQAIEHQKSLLKQSIAETQTLLDSRMQEYFG